MWRETKYHITHSFKDRANGDQVSEVTKSYEKAYDRWTPIYSRRPYRPVFYIGIHTTIPILEYLNFIKTKTGAGKQDIRYRTNELTDHLHGEIKAKASYILNKNYTNIYEHIVNDNTEDLFGLSTDGITYSQISMGAGEQRLLKILKTIFSAPKHSLILIDEIDLLLHDDAFQKLLDVITIQANKEDVQIIFTTHRESVLKKKDKINIRYLYKQNDFTSCLNEVTPDAMHSLTGTLQKTITIYVEDKLSSRIVKTICQELNISRHVSIIEFGSASNAFAICGSNETSVIDSIYFAVIDGDVFRSPVEKISEMNRHFAGTSQAIQEIKRKALERIYQYSLPDQKSPEQYIKESITKIPQDDVPANLLEIFNALRQIQAVLDKHNYINTIMDQYDESPDIIIKDVVELFSKTDEWQGFVLAIKEKLAEIKQSQQL